MAKKKQKKENQKKEQQKKGTPYDDAFRSLYIRCEKLVLFLLNETFGTNYVGDEELHFMVNETFLRNLNGKKKRRISDSRIEVKDHAGNVRRFQVECQSVADKNMAMRILEYSLSFALDAANVNEVKATAEIQNAAVLYLRSSDNTPVSYEMEVVAPNQQSICWNVPTIKVADYTLNDLFDKRLYFLLPFYVFNFENQLEKMDVDENERRILTSTLENMKGKILELEQNGDISSEDTDSLLDNCRDVADSLLEKYENVRKEVEEIMGGRDYRTRSQVAYDRGIAKGETAGLKKGLRLGREEGREEGEFSLALSAIKKGILSLDYFTTEEKWSSDKMRRFEKYKREQMALLS